MHPIVRIWNTLLGNAARLAVNSGMRGQGILNRLLYALTLGDGALSVYGVWLVKNWSDATCRFALTGAYGNQLYETIRALDARSVFLDIGSNTGLYAFVAEKNKNVVQAYAIEPNPHLASILQRNKSLNNSRIEVLDVGIGDANRSSGFEFDPLHSGKGKVTQIDGSSTKIRLRNYELFDEIAANHPECRFFCKIDVEGLEAVVVDQIARSNIRDRLIGATVEIDNRWHSEEEKAAIRQTLTSCGLVESGRFGDEGHYDLYFTRC